MIGTMPGSQHMTASNERGLEVEGGLVAGKVQSSPRPLGTALMSTSSLRLRSGQIDYVRVLFPTLKTAHLGRDCQEMYLSY